MNPPAILALAMLVTVAPLPAQGPVFFADEEHPGAFRDLTIRQLVDAAELLARPGMPASPLPEAADDVTFCHPDALLFCEINTLGPGEPFQPIRCESLIHEISPAALPTSDPVAFPADPIASASGFVVNCADTDPGGVVPAWQPARTESPPSEADRVPEPSAILLLVGAAAWILLRRKL